MTKPYTREVIDILLKCPRIHSVQVLGLNVAKEYIELIHPEDPKYIEGWETIAIIRQLLEDLDKAQNTLKRISEARQAYPGGTGGGGINKSGGGGGKEPPAELEEVIKETQQTLKELKTK